MKIIVDTHNRTVRIDNDWNESKHPRRRNGEFAPAGTITVRGNELGGFNMTKQELRTRAKQYYKEKLAGTTVRNKELGKVLFSNRGYEKPISLSGDERKLLLFPFLPQIIETGHVISKQDDRYGRVNVDVFYTLESEINFKGNTEKVRVTIRADNNGRLYYDHVISKNPGLGSSLTNEAVTQATNNSIADSNLVVNIFFDGGDK